MVEVHEQAIGFLGIKLDHHIQHRCVAFVNVFQRFFGFDHRRFCQGHAVIVAEHIPVKLFQIFVQMRAVIEIAKAFGGGHNVIVGKPFFFGNESNHIFPETVHTQIQPEPQDLLDLFPYQRIVHVQICLLNGEQVHIVFLAYFVPSPGLAFKEGVPVVGQFAVCLGRSPDVVIGVGFDPLTGFLEPCMGCAGVVDHQIHNDLHAPFVGPVQHLAERLHTAEFFGNVHIVGDVIAAVHTGGGV